MSEDVGVAIVVAVADVGAGGSVVAFPFPIHLRQYRYRPLLLPNCWSELLTRVVVGLTVLEMKPESQKNVEKKI